MYCFICLSTDDKLQKLEKDLNIDFLNQITFILPDVVIPESQDPIFICAACPEQVEFFFTIKKSSLGNFTRLKYYSDIILDRGDFMCSELTIELNEDELLTQQKKDKEFKINSDREDLLSSEDQEDSNSSTNDSDHIDKSKTKRANKRKPFKCRDCHKTFIYKKAFKRHAGLHTGEQLYKCPICQKIFATFSSVNRHKRTHTSEKPHECDVCHKKFIQRHDLKRHRLTHNKIRQSPQYQCNVCDSLFTEAGSLRRHLRPNTDSNSPSLGNRCSNKRKTQHTSEKKLFECSDCHQTFTAKNNLTRHKHVHTGQRPYKCAKCHKTFTRSTYLNDHKLIHTR